MRLSKDEGLRLLAGLVEDAKVVLEETHPHICSKADLVERLLAGTLPRGRKGPHYNRVRHLASALEQWRSARRYFVEPSSGFVETALEVGLDPDAVREEVRPLLALPWNGRLLHEAIQRWFGRIR